MTFKQALKAWNRQRLDRQRNKRAAARGEGDDYVDWVANFDTVNDALRENFRARAANLQARPLISVLMPVYNPEPAWLAEALDSVLAQAWPHWELCIADDRSTDPRIAEVLGAYAARDTRIRVVHRSENGHISAASNTALEMARGSHVALLDHDDLLPEHALLCVAETLARHPDAAVIYSDEDKIDGHRARREAYFKSAWNPELFRGHNMISHFGVYSTQLVRDVGGFRVGFEGAQDYDLALRCVDAVAHDRILHIPHVLYHWRIHAESTSAGNAVKPYALEAGRRALRAHFVRRGIAGDIGVDPAGWYLAQYRLPEPAPSVSVIVSGASAEAIAALQGATDYPGAVFLPAAATPAACQQVAAHALGDFLVFVDAECTPRDPHWLRHLLAHAAVPGVGAAAGKLVSAKGRITGAGKLLGLEPWQVPFSQRERANGTGYCGRAALSQSLSALGSGCLAVRREAYAAVEGFDPTFRSLDVAAIDLTLRLARTGWRNLWAPVVEMGHVPSMKRRIVDAFRALVDGPRVGARFEDAAYNPNLGRHGRFRFAYPPRAAIDFPAQARRGA